MCYLACLHYPPSTTTSQKSKKNNTQQGVVDQHPPIKSHASKSFWGWTQDSSDPFNPSRNTKKLDSTTDSGSFEVINQMISFPFCPNQPLSGHTMNGTFPASWCLVLLAAGLIENKNKANTLCLSAYQMDLSEHNGVTKAKVYHPNYLLPPGRW